VEVDMAAGSPRDADDTEPDVQLLHRKARDELPTIDESVKRTLIHIDVVLRPRWFAILIGLVLAPPVIAMSLAYVLDLTPLDWTMIAIVINAIAVWVGYKALFERVRVDTA
jgi:hypothetical protein